ncbi:hypothetical protein GCM10007415_44580 [Parapedobacter pyrenivorans]|uniref:DUF5107 domain-containing protein n=1 Tax=Parapedobacter pyrenivorans TaxID=1305674 RepID=A0A917MFB1_9SPHI|nr:DUF5107 domain-containing protein [Parapedobacter pyrenivorans]GGH03456.1 hypothetical protein GCM10007415_44580 [Parapedobacter pyrenivorans]
MRKTLITPRMEQGLDIICMENDHLRVDVIPALGGKISSVFNKEYKKEFLWHNEKLDLQENRPGDDYDSHFLGGIDELLPNDLPEEIDGTAYPDHGELWTCRLEHAVSENAVSVYGVLPLSGLHYRKTVCLETGTAKIKLTYHIINESGERRRFLWKLHAALRIAPGDRLVTPARQAKVVNLAASRFGDPGEFKWPVIAGVDASVVPEKNGTMDFFYLYDSPAGEMALLSENGKCRFSYLYDQRVFPYQWYFASYGQFRDHYTAILEPASAMPVQVNEAADRGQCSVLEPGESIDTVVTIYAGGNG